MKKRMGLMPIRMEMMSIGDTSVGSDQHIDVIELLGGVIG